MAAATALGAAVFLSSCNEEELADAKILAGEDSKPAKPAAVEKSDSGLNMVGGSGGSAHFDTVASHLHLGGEVFAYIDVDGDVEKVAGMIRGMLDKVPDGELPPHIENLDLAKVLSEIGIDGIEAVGASSYKDGELYHNRAFLYVPEGRKGLLKVFGGDAAPFVSASLAPEDSDLVIEQTLNIRAAYDVVSAMVMRFGGEDASREFQEEMGNETDLGLAMAEIFGKLDTRLTMVARVHPDKPLEIPDAPIEVPSFDFMIALDDTGWLYEKITGKMKSEMPPEQVEQMFVKGEGFEKIALPPMPPEMPMMEPLIQHDVKGKRVLIASSQAFLDECLAGKTKLSDSSDFKLAMTGLPAEGNGLSYASSDLMKAIRKLHGDTVKATEGQPGAKETLILAMASALLPKGDNGQAKVSVNQKDGIFVSSNSSASMKEGAILGAGSFWASLVGLTFAKSSRPQSFDREFELREEAFPAPREIPSIPE